MKNYAIKIENLTKSYRIYPSNKARVKETLSIRKKSYHQDFFALNNISFEVKKGETVGIIGTNGAGKSTLLKIITGVLQKTSGNIEINGRVSALLELGAGFNPELTGIENIYFHGMMMGFKEKEMAEKLPDIISFADIGDFINLPVKNYSSGMFARLAFAVAINVEPDILIVDEALSVGDIFFQNKCFKKFEELRSKNITVLFVSHDISSVRQMCSRVIWIEKGQQKIFDNSDLVCDMYMDEKRLAMNQSVSTIKSSNQIELHHCTSIKRYPKIMTDIDRFGSTQLKILSTFITNINEEIVTTLSVDQTYTIHSVIEFEEDIDNLIAGFVFENNKGLPLFDLNNYINQQEVFSGKKGTIAETRFCFKLPRIMHGQYLVSTAVAQGTQEEHKMLTWLHAALNIEVVNMGYNSSYIEIPCTIKIDFMDKDHVEIYS